MPYAARAALRMQSLNDEACRLMGAGGERDLSRAEDLLRRALAMEVVEQPHAFPRSGCCSEWCYIRRGPGTCTSLHMRVRVLTHLRSRSAPCLPSCTLPPPPPPPRPRLLTIPPPVQPSYAAPLCNYGRLLQKQQRDLDLAGDMMAKAVRLQPAQAALMSSYALFLEDGVRDPVRAQEVYERALQLHPSDTVCFVLLILRRRGRVILNSDCGVCLTSV